MSSIKTEKKKFANMFAICKHIQPDKAYKINYLSFLKEQCEKFSSRSREDIEKVK